MENLVDFALKQKYFQVKKLRSRLEDMKKLIDWEKFLPLFPDKETNRGRPSYEKILMLKLLFLQSWYGISDEELEFQVYDRLSFQQFLDYPKDIPDYPVNVIASIDGYGNMKTTIRASQIKFKPGQPVTIEIYKKKHPEIEVVKAELIEMF